MPINRLFGSGLAVGQNALDLRLEKQGLIQSNIANMNTPGYTTQDFSFEKALEAATSGQTGLERTHPGHMQIKPQDALEAVEFSKEKRPVDLDEEMLKLSENGLMYQVTTRIVSKKLEGIKFAIDEGSK